MFWSNNLTNSVMTQVRLEAGFQSGQVNSDGRTLVSKGATTDPQSLTLAANAQSELARKLSRFGWLRGTVASIGDLTEPADPGRAGRTDNV